MSKRINLPTDSWSHIELSDNEPVPQSRLINHVYIVWCCFIVHTHTTISAGEGNVNLLQEDRNKCDIYTEQAEETQHIHML